MICNVLGHIVGQVKIEQLGFALDDGDTGLKIRRLNVSGQAPLKPGAQTLLQRFDLLRRAVRRDDDLPAIVVQRVEGVEKLLLRALLAGQELDVVDEQHIRLAVFLTELLHRRRLDGGNRLVGEHFTIHVNDVEIRVIFLDLKLDGVQKVGLAQARRPIDEQRVVRAGRVRRHGLRGRKRKLVRRSLDEILKGEIIPAAGQRFLVPLVRTAVGLLAVLRRGRHIENFHIKAENGLERFFQQRRVAIGYDLHHKFTAQFQRDGVGIFKAHGLDILDVKCVGSVRGLFLAVGLDRFQYLIDGIHECRYSPLPVYDGTPCAENRAQKY